MAEITLAFDYKPSARTKDDNGFLHVSESNISKEIVNPYYGREIPGWREAGLDPNRVYYGYRSGEELAKAASTFDGLPLLMGHHYESADAPQKDYRVGSIGTGVRWQAPYLIAPLTVTDKTAIDAIESGTAKEISCSYAYEPDFVHGTHDGISYDFVMRNIKGNHVALVEAGRAGADVVVSDAMPDGLSNGEKLQTLVERCLMSIFKRGFRGVANDNDPEVEKKEVDLAQAIIDLHKVNPETGEVMDVTEDEDKAAEIKALIDRIAGKLDEEEIKEFAEKLHALAGIGGDDDPAVEVKEEAEEVIADEGEENPLMGAMKAAADKCGMDAESPEFQRAFAEGVKYGEEKEKAEPKKLDSEHESEGMEKALGKDEEDAAEEVKAAMDAALKQSRKMQIQHFRDLSKAGSDTRSVMGDIDVLAFDSAEDIYGAALRKMGIPTDGHPKSAWRSMYAVARRDSGVRVANDAKASAGLFETFKNLSKIEC